MNWYYLLPLLLLFPLAAAIYRLIRARRIYSRSRSQFQYFFHQNSYDYALFDIRDRVSYEKGHIPRAVHFPLSELNYLPLEDMFVHIFVYGDRKDKSRHAREYLSKNGYFNVYDLGHFKHWKDSLEKGEGIHIQSFAEEVRKNKKEAGNL